MKFSIRDLMWLMLSIGVGLGWGVNSWRLSAENTRLRDRTSALEAEILIHTVEQQTNPSSALAPPPYLPGLVEPTPNSTTK